MKGWITNLFQGLNEANQADSATSRAPQTETRGTAQQAGRHKQKQEELRHKPGATNRNNEDYAINGATEITQIAYSASKKNNEA